MNERERFNRLSLKVKKLFDYITKEKITIFSPIELVDVFGVSNRTIINSELCENGYLKPNIINKRIRTYSLIT